ncbi:TPA: hypothetical protein EYP44_03925 [Candidatus Bathyarchaeota archaeon]|nr:hypothetical protein [Candidatus Bathyarchaeota archaeon]
MYNLERCFNVREGIRRRDDTLPQRLLREPVPVGPARGAVCPLEPMLDEYYGLRGWDKKTGAPTPERLRRLGLGKEAGTWRAPLGSNRVRMRVQSRPTRPTGVYSGPARWRSR